MDLHVGEASYEKMVSINSPLGKYLALSSLAQACWKLKHPHNINRDDLGSLT
jgi:hypothetical protein